MYTHTYISTCTDKTLSIQILYVILLGDQIDLLVTNDCDFILPHDKTDVLGLFYLELDLVKC